jgi:CubicO group peptidase (beta-lactamase class C family)
MKSSTRPLSSRLPLASVIAVALTVAAPLAQTPIDSAQGKPAVRAPGASATRAGFSVERLRRVDALLQRYVDENRLGGAVALVLRDGQPVYEKAVGWSDKEAGRRMSMDTIFRIASQTKAITSVAVLQLMEEGRLGLADPVSKWVPAFATTTVQVSGPNGTTVVPAKRPITIRDLLTHTAGISYGVEPRVAALYEAKGLGPAAGRGWYFADKDDGVCPSIERLATVPFVAQPGEEWVYGYNTDVLGCVVERVTGQSLEAVVKARITGPLGMTDTQFFLAPAQRARLAALYGSAPDGTIARAPEGASGQGHYVEGPRRSFSGGAGLLSTARDYARFLEALRLGGAIDGVRILSPRAVQLMTTNQVGTLHSATGLGFGLGFETTDRYGANGMDGAGSFGWGGAYGTVYRVDPEARVVLVLMLQLMPNNTDIRTAFPTAVYQAIVDPAARALPATH